MAIKRIFFFLIIPLFLLFSSQQFIQAAACVKVGSEQLFEVPYKKVLAGKKIGLVSNHTAISSEGHSTYEMLKNQAIAYDYTLSALFAPEHGFNGAAYAGESVLEVFKEGIPIYSLHGKTRRPTSHMLQDISLLIYDIQDIGSRSYTYITTLFYVMEEAARHHIPLIVLDRPNPINGLTIDGPLLKEQWRSFLSYINVPYCHAMTAGELAYFFNSEYKVACDLTVIPMKGWKRSMQFSDTGLTWIPPSPHIPEASTVFFYPTTGLLGELALVNIGIGYTLPFKLIGAPWIEAENFAATLNKQNFLGVHFKPFYYRPFYGKFAQQECQGCLIIVTDPLNYKPVTTQYMILGILKSLYPIHFKKALVEAASRREIFCKVNGTEEVYEIMANLPHIVWPLILLHQKQREDFQRIRKKYLIGDYEKSESTH